MVDPSTGDNGEAIKMRYVICGEEAGEDVTDQATDGVLSEDIKGVIDAEDELEFGCVIGT